jgi:chromosome segregation ATPase
MIDPLGIPSTVVEALTALADTAKRLPDLASHLDARATRLEEDITAMRHATERLTEINGVVESIDARVGNVEESVAAIEGSVEPLDARLAAVQEGIGGVDARLQGTSQLQKTTNDAIDALVEGVEPLEKAIGATTAHAERIHDQLATVLERVGRVEAGLAEVNGTLTPLGDAAGRLLELRDRLPGGS